MDIIKELTLKNHRTATVDLQSGESVEIISSYPFYFGALYRQEKLLRNKIEEIQHFKFVPQDIDNDPTIPSDMKWLHKEQDTKRNQLHRIHGDTLSDIRISIIIFASSLIEGIIAEYLLLHSASTKEFNTLEKQPLTEKWKSIPKQFAPTYTLPAHLEESLNELISKRRKFLIHDKPTLIENHTVTIQGKEVIKATNETDLLLQWCQLPEELISNLLSHEPDINKPGTRMFSFKDTCKYYLRLRKMIVK